MQSRYDNYKIPVRIYEPTKKTKDIILFVHGGGWGQGSVDTHDILCRKISKNLDKTVVSVGYRLSPEYKFPVPLGDVFSVYVWCTLEYKKIILCGDSVGGNLCASLCVKLNVEKYPVQPILQILFYPILSNNIESKSFDLFGRGYGLTTEWTKDYIYQYTGAEYNDKRFSSNKLIYPVLADGDIFPMTFLVSASCDVLLDGQLEFIRKLPAKKIVHRIVNGSIHGFMTYGKYFDRVIDLIISEMKSLIINHHLSKFH